MRRIVLSLTAASAIVVAVSLAPHRADAMPAGTVADIQAALADSSLVVDVAYVCRHRFYTSRRVCWWRPNYRRWRRW